MIETESAVRCRGVRFRPGKDFEIHDLDLDVPSGSIYGFLGPNGSGKTTLIRLLLGMARADAGEIEVLGRPIPSEVARALSRVGYVPERPHLYPSLTVAECIRFHRAFYPSWRDGAEDGILRRLGLPGDRTVKQLSKGETGKLLVLLALAQGPDLLVLDEPTDGLDPVVRRDVVTWILDYVSETGATVFVSSHLVHELERICDWVGVIDAGRLVAELPMQSFKQGIKRIRVSDAPDLPGDTPFLLLSRRGGDGFGTVETWVVRGWQDPMRQYFEGMGARVREVVDLDLEEGFVELLRSSRTGREED